ncbi:hypothetical protein HUU53_00235 [Candidatus Micrarchaeota archaeon]|nr:hypothetical protein [Candidatus Micrarchaeota archaeon]
MPSPRKINKTISKKPVKAKTKKIIKQVKNKVAKLKQPKAITPPVMEEKPKADPKLIQPFISEVAGERGLKVIEAIGDGAIDEKIEEKTKYKMAEIRHVLNLLHNHGIVEYSRVKNLETGWFTYTWSVNSDRALSNYLMKKKNEYEELRSRLSASENTTIYACKAGCCKLPFDEAFDAQFKCPSCEKKLQYTENKSELKELETKISSLQQILERKV